MEQKKLLKIRKASAGSGKTFLLVENYLTLLLKKKQERSFPHRAILAVTFTNKATEEMKTRILKELFLLSDTQKISKLRDSLCKKLNYDKEKLASQSKEVLLEILYDYSSFHISTIDKFFLKIIRSFSREINLQSDYSIELDVKKVLTEAVKNMFFNLDEKDKLFEWLLSFSKDKIDGNKSWNIDKDVLNLSNDLFKEDVKVLDVSQIQNLTQLEEYRKSLKQIVNDFDKEATDIADRAESIRRRYGIRLDSFKYPNAPFYNQFIKAIKRNYDSTDRFEKAVNNGVEEWYKDKSPQKNEIIDAYNNGWKECAEELYDLIKKDSVRLIQYNSAKKILSKIYELGIISDVTKEIKNYLDKEGIMLLADMNEFLSEITKNSETPFIYEKTGISIDHFMLDEFQDTSSLQWKNFRPLIKESLASGNENLIVGDVKQSIYRWRNSDWDLLNSKIESDKDFNPYIDDDSSALMTNRRSLRNIVEFNNSFFKFASKEAKTSFENINEVCEKYSGKITTAYDVLEQNVWEEKKGDGNVELSFIKNTKEEKFFDSALALLVKRIEELQDRGFSLSDIAILVRENKHARLIAEYLSKCEKKEGYCYNIISNEALLVDRSNSIQLLVSVMSYFAFPNEKKYKYFFLYNYFTVVKKKTPKEALEEIQKCLDNDNLQKEIFGENLSSLQKGSLYEQVESLIRFFGLSENPDEIIFIQTFQDIVFDYTKKYNADMIRFLNYWEEKKKSCFLPASEESQDAINITTIHKSKGLAFKVVIIPFCNWSLNQKDHLLWLKTENKGAPFNKFPIVSIGYSNLEKTIFSEQYYEEKMQGYVDVLNLIYVAFTRAEDELYVFIEEKDKNEVTLPSFMKNYVESNGWQLSESDNYSKNIYRKGEFESKETSPVKDKSKENDILELLYPTEDIDWHKSLLSKKMWKSSDSSSVKMNIDKGVFMHEVMSKIETLDDLPSAVESYVRSGKITSAQSEEFFGKIKGFIKKHDLENWFSGEYKVLNEIDILSNNTICRRPDRVMLFGDRAIVVDYKFGQKESFVYKKQIEKYCEQIKDMGYKQVEGFLCYVELDKIIQIV
ncbi:MAG: UvrD-helicase domain-containing protein [Paludibacteraceae bacterium]|nr:UvrD-helicase domain-containing protein [Paludibacteraceae bacterium]